jgi:hypothetical protein
MRSIGSTILVTILVIIAFFGLGPLPQLEVHGQSAGLVCLAGPQSTNCPPAPLAISALNGTQLTVAVNIQNSNQLNGFDILVKGDPKVLRGSSVDLGGSVLGSNIFTIAECIDFRGFGCSGANGIGAVEVAAVALGYSTLAPTTGRLFSITYNATQSSSAVEVDFQTGCSKTSVSPDFCVTVVNGANIVPETVQGSTGQPGDFSISSAFCCPTLPKNSDGLGSVTLQSQGGFFGGLSLSISVSPLRKSGPVAFFLTSARVFLEPETSTLMLLLIVTFPTTSPVGFTVTVTATSGFISHSADITFRVSPH